jgi:hypothetical protein
LAAFLFVVTINVAILAILDFALVKLDLLSPPLAFGMPGVGFGNPGVLRSSRFGVPRLGDVPHKITAAMVGDSHSQLIFANRLDTHEFVLESALRAQGIPIEMISAGRGRYSPLQEYLLFKLELREEYHPQLLLMNFYSGNDFYDMLRPDDRPYFSRNEANAIVMRDPMWISFVNPDSRSWIERSRLLWGMDELASRLGLPRVVQRLRMVSAAADRPGHSLRETWRYISALNESQEPRLGYPAAFTAQILNQALFLKHFPESKDESIAFMRHLLALVRTENPGLLPVIAPIPSAAVMNAIPRDLRQSWRETLDRTSLTESGVAGVENELVDRLKAVSIEAGWMFIDLRDCLRGYQGTEDLYSSYDLHISAVASRMIGHCQASALLASDAFKKLQPPSTD